MKILEIKIVDNNLIINTDSNSSVTTLYIDNLYNKENRFEEDAEKHNYIIDNINITDAGISIDLDTLEPELDLSAFTVLVNGVLGFYYDDKELYYKEIDVLTNYCSTCLDNAQKETLTLVILRKQLLEYAKEHNMVECQINHYEDLARLLKIDLKSDGAKSNCNCKNGVCSVC